MQLMDQGLGMPIATMTIPQNWSLIQDISTNPETGLIQRYKNILVGPQNQFKRVYAAHFLFGIINNAPYEHALHAATDHVLGPENLQGVQFGPMQRNASLEKNPYFQAMRQSLASSGSDMQAFEAEFTAERNRKQYKGKIAYVSQYHSAGFGIVMPNSLIFSTADRYDETLRIINEIAETSVDNPQYYETMIAINREVQQRSDEYSRRMMDQSRVAHQRLMADRDAAFASHQRNMAGLNQIQDVAHASFLEQLRSSGSFTSIDANRYSSHDAFVDQIHERSTFHDPCSGQDVSLDGQYEYNFTNGLGDYYRTNDASFNQHSLQGDWNPISPLG